MAPAHTEKTDSMIGRVFRDCKIQEKIAVGGFGTVYKAIDVKLDVTRAIKIFHAHLSEEKGFRKRFEIEMRLLAHLDHPNIVRIIGAIEEPEISGFIMEFVEGETLSDILDNQGALPIPKAIDIFTQVGKAIGYAHNLKNQIIHRDLSPDNVMLRPDGIVKIMDFGIAKTIGAERVTQTGIVLGKPIYMAPEQFEGTVSIYTDQYSLGVIFYEMVTGRVPFDAEAPIALYKLHLNEPPVPPREINDQIPVNVDKVILKALSKSEKDRFKSVDAMLEALLNESKAGHTVDNKIPSLLIKINQAIEKQNLTKAEEMLKEVLSYDPDNKEALAKQEEVSKLLQIQKDQDLIEEWFQQAHVFLNSGLKDEACGCISDLLKVASQYPAVKTIREYKEKLQKQMPDMFEQASSIVEEDWQRSQEYTNDGQMFLDKESYQDALECFEKALLINPYNQAVQGFKAQTEKKIKLAQVAVWYKDGIIAIKNQDYQKALDCFENILKISPDHKDAKKYKEMAQTEMQKLQKNRSEVDAAYREALSSYEKWDFTLAMERIEHVLSMDNAHKDAQLLLLETKARLADENKLEEIGFFYNQGLTFYKSQEWEKALTCFNRVLKYMENHKGALEYKQLAEDKVKQQQQIEKIFEEVLEHFRNSEYTSALEKLNLILSQDKNHKGAKQYKVLCEELQGFKKPATAPNT